MSNIDTTEPMDIVGPKNDINKDIIALKIFWDEIRTSLASISKSFENMEKNMNGK